MGGRAGGGGEVVRGGGVVGGRPLPGPPPGAWRGCYVSRRKGLWATRGFTLLEVLVGAAVLSVGLLGMAAMFPTGYTNITPAGEMTMAPPAGGGGPPGEAPSP